MRMIGRVVLGSKYDSYHSPDERELEPAEIARLLREVGFATVRIGYNDLTLHPAQYVLAKWPGWPLYIFPAIDWLWCRSPFARWASGFTVLGSTAGLPHPNPSGE